MGVGARHIEDTGWAARSYPGGPHAGHRPRQGADLAGSYPAMPELEQSTEDVLTLAAAVGAVLLLVPLHSL
jgi:hypothetical protein